MITLPNYSVSVPLTPELNLSMKARYREPGSRGANDTSVQLVPNDQFGPDPNAIVSNYTFTLPIPPLSRDWLEVYINNFRLINPTTTARYFDPTLSQWSYVGNSNNKINITYPFTRTTEVKFIHDRSEKHHYGALMIDLDNIQGLYERKTLNDFLFYDYPILSGRSRGVNYTIYHRPGVKFETNSNIIIRECQPSTFNGTYKVVKSDLNSVSFTSSVAINDNIKKRGTITGFGNGTITSNTGISLYCEPVIISQPYNGYARLTTDRKRIAYTPNLSYVGKDTFAVSLINQNGQLAEPKCILIEMTPNT